METYPNILVIFVVDDVNGLLDVPEHEVAVTVVGLG